MLPLLMSTPFGISAPLLIHNVSAELTRQEEVANGSFKNRFKELWPCCKSLRWRVPERKRKFQRNSNLVQLRLAGLKACGLKSSLDGHPKQTDVLVKGGNREEQDDFDCCYLIARVDENQKPITGRNDELCV